MTRKLGLLTVAAAAVAAFFLLRAGPDVSAPGEVAADPAGATPAERRGALVDQVVFTQAADAGRAVGEIETGAYHVFAQGISSPTIFQRVRDSHRLTHDVSYGRNTELTINPVGPEFATGELNPFHVREIREALNWLINRRYVAEEIFGGLAVPRFLPLNNAFPDYARLADVARALEQRYRHDPARAEAVIRREMEALGASLQDNRWTYNGAPVRIRIIIRTDDARLRVGDYISNLLEDVGFEVERQYRTAEEATRIWIGTDPAAGRWHLYTGGWVAVVVNRDEGDSLSYYYTPRGRPDPLWQAYTPDPELDEVADRLARRDYETWEERQELMARGLELAVQDSVRVWIVDQLSITPRAVDVELAVDLAGGVSGSRLWPYTIRLRDQVGGNLVVAVPSLLTEPWNPVAGSNWIFDQMIIRALNDPELLPDPYTGLYWPQRIASAEVTVKEGVPVGRTHDWLTLETADEIIVPEEAWIDWNAAEQRFITVREKHPEGITARTRTRVRYEDGYLSRRWHDGSQVSLADIVLPWILTFERADEASRLFDPSHVPVFETYLRHFRGWQIISTDPLVIDVYSDQIFPDAETIVAARTPSASPWHTLALGIRAEQAGQIAFSSNKADRMRVDWLSMVAGPSLPILDRHLDIFRTTVEVPFAQVLERFLRQGEAAERYDALHRWRRERGHFWVGAGPLYLHSVHPIEGSLVVRRFEDFPDPADKWLRFIEPEIPELNLDGPMTVEISETARFDLDITFRGEPYPDEAIEQEILYLFDGMGELITQADARRSAEGRWRIELSADEVAALGLGANSLEVAVTSTRVALPSFATHAFATIPRRPTPAGGAS